MFRSLVSDEFSTNQDARQVSSLSFSIFICNAVLPFRTFRTKRKETDIPSTSSIFGELIVNVFLNLFHFYSSIVFNI